MRETHGNTTQLQTLLDRAGEGDDGAHGELIAKAADRLLRLTRKMLRNYPHLTGNCPADLNCLFERLVKFHIGFVGGRIQLRSARF